MKKKRTLNWYHKLLTHSCLFYFSYCLVKVLVIAAVLFSYEERYSEEVVQIGRAVLGIVKRTQTIFGAETHVLALFATFIFFMLKEYVSMEQKANE